MSNYYIQPLHSDIPSQVTYTNFDNVGTFNIDTVGTNVYLYSESSGSLIAQSTSTPWSYDYDLNNWGGIGRYIFIVNDDGGACGSLDYANCIISQPVLSHYSLEVGDSPYNYPSYEQIVVVNTTILTICALFWLIRQFIKL